MTFQIVVLIRHPSGLAWILVIAAAVTSLAALNAWSAIDSWLHIATIVDDYVKRFAGCKMQVRPVSAYVDASTLRALEELTVEASVGLAPARIERRLRLIEIEPLAQSTIPSAVASYTAFSGRGVVFILKPDLPLHPFIKFMILHELGHSRFASYVYQFEFAVMPSVYTLFLAWSLIATQWSWQAALVWLVILAVALDYRGASSYARARLDRLQDEITADTIAVQLLDDAERAQLAQRLRKNRRTLWDAKMTDDDNSIRIERLLTALENRPFSPDDPVISHSVWDRRWRLLLFILLATYAKPPVWWMPVVLAGLVAIYGVVIWIAMGYHLRTLTSMERSFDWSEAGG